MLDLTQAILNLGFLAGAFTLGYAADRYVQMWQLFYVTVIHHMHMDTKKGKAVPGGFENF
jgi:hypothetical protein